MVEYGSNLVPFTVLGDEEERPRIGLELSVYAYNDPFTKLETLPERRDLKALDEIGGPGAGSFKISKIDSKLVEQPNLLGYRNICKVSLDQKVIGAFLVGRKKAEYVNSKEFAGEVWSVSGGGLREWFRDAVVEPYGGIRTDSQSERVFSFASERGSWYKPADWITPKLIQKHSLDPNEGPFITAPAEWPDAENAYWIWGTENSKASPAPEGVNYFRHEFTIAPEVGTKSYSVFASAREHFDVFVDGQQVIEARDTDSWAQTWRADFTLAPGDHVLAVRVQANGTATAGMIAALFRAGNADEGTAAELLNVTDASTWLANPYPDPPPGWTPGEIILTLLSEAAARGVRFPSFLTPTFTAEEDSNGQTWPRNLDWSFNLGTEYIDIIEKLEEIVCDVWINPDTLELNMYVERGTNRTTQSRAVQPVKFEIGRNITQADEEGVSDIKNTLLMSTKDGWVGVSDGSSDSISRYGRIEGYLSTQSSPAVSADVAQKVFDHRSIPETTATYAVIDVDDARPFVDYFVGDWVLAPTSSDDYTLVPRRVMSISVAEDNRTGHPELSIEFDTIFQDAEARYERWLKTTSDGTLGGTLANVSGGAGGISATPAAQAAGRGAMGLQGPQGLPGFRYRGVWSALLDYRISDVVYYNNKFWVSSEEVSLETPDTSASWDELKVTPDTAPMPSVSLYRDTSFSMPTTATLIPWTHERFKAVLEHEVAAAEITITADGPYLIFGEFRTSLSTSSSSSREFTVLVNDVPVVTVPSVRVSNSTSTGTARIPGIMVDLALGDVVTIQTQGNYANTLDVANGATWLSIIGATGSIGPEGPTGPAGTIASATAIPLDPGENPTVTLGGIPEERSIEFGIPRGLQGDVGPAGTVDSATAVDLPAGDVPTVTLGGTPSARTIEFGIPAGEQGIQGPPGDPLKFRGTWDALTTYDPSDSVEHGGSVWVTAVESTNLEPGVASEWVEISSGGGGTGVPPGGTTGQVLTKLSDIDGEADWQTPTTDNSEGREVLPSLVTTASVSGTASSLTFPDVFAHVGQTLLLVISSRSSVVHPEGWDLVGVVGPAIGNPSSAPQRISVFSRTVEVSQSVSQTIELEESALMYNALLVLDNVGIALINPELTEAFQNALYTPVVKNKPAGRAYVWGVSQNYWQTSGDIWTVDPTLPEVIWPGNNSRLGVFFDVGSGTRTFSNVSSGNQPLNYNEFAAIELIGKIISVPRPSRETSTMITTDLGDVEESQTTIKLARGYRVLTVETDIPARIRLYATTAHQAADADRPIGTDPIGNHGLILEYVTTSDMLEAVLSPVVDGASMETIPDINIPITVTNLSGSSSTVQVDITYVRTE